MKIKQLNYNNPIVIWKKSQGKFTWDQLAKRCGVSVQGIIKVACMDKKKIEETYFSPNIIERINEALEIDILNDFKE